MGAERYALREGRFLPHPPSCQAAFDFLLCIPQFDSPMVVDKTNVQRCF